MADGHCNFTEERSTSVCNNKDTVRTASLIPSFSLVLHIFATKQEDLRKSIFSEQLLVFVNIHEHYEISQCFNKLSQFLC